PTIDRLSPIGLRCLRRLRPRALRSDCSREERHMRKSATGNWSKRVGVSLTVFACVSFAALTSHTEAAQSKQLTLCWAAWDPANALVELGKDFTKETGIEMKYEFVPWTSYADRILNEINSHEIGRAH